MTVTPWATTHLGLAVDHVASSTGDRVEKLVVPGLRKNPKRAHLLVSTVLGKHLPTHPDVVTGAAHRLAGEVRTVLGADAADAVVFGFAETATGLGHGVADALDSFLYLHSTRRDVPNIEAAGGFEEGHSHATSHRLLPTSASLLDSGAPLVLVDDEISTGATASDAVSALQRIAPRDRYVVASLVDMRTDDHHDAIAEGAARLGVRVDSVALATGFATLPDGLIGAVAALPETASEPAASEPGRIVRIDIEWPAGVPDGGRHGFLRDDRPAFELAAREAAAAIDTALEPGRPAVVIGHEELMHLPLSLAHRLDRPSLFQTTTRSPAYVLDEPGYPLRRGFRFRAPEFDAEADRYLYNARFPEHDDAVLVVVIDEPADTEHLTGPGGLLDALTAAGHDVLLAVVRGADPIALRESRR